MLWNKEIIPVLRHYNRLLWIGVSPNEKADLIVNKNDNLKSEYEL